MGKTSWNKDREENVPSILVNSIMKGLEKIHLRSDLSSDTLEYIYVINMVAKNCQDEHET